MEILKFRMVLAMFILLITSSLSAQTQTELNVAFAKSYSLESSKKYMEAVNNLLKVYKDDSYEMNLRLGWLYYEAGVYDKSTSYYSKAINLMPAATEPLWGVIYPYIAKEDWVNAEKTYLSILKLDPKNATANYRLGLIYYYRKNFTTAQKYLSVSLNLNPFDHDSLLMSAWTNYFLGKNTEAKVLFGKVILNTPNDVSALEGLSLIK